MPERSDNLELLLVHADTRKPVLDQGLPAGTAAEHERPQRDTLAPLQFWDEGSDPNDLEAQRWGLILPEGPRGDRLRDLIKPLIELRREQQGGHPIKEYRVPAGPMTMAEAAQWRKRYFDAGESMNTDVPRYQLILGDLDQVPLAIQQMQATDGYVGRLHFSEEWGYEAYVEKVLRAEKLPRKGPGRVVIHTAYDGSPALDAAADAIINPGVELMRGEMAQGRFPASGCDIHDQVMEPGLARFLERTSAPELGVLFSISQGIGAPQEGHWASEAERLEFQGAMSFGQEGPLRADELASRPFMPNGIWFMFGCFGAGTPDTSAYAHWLRKLVEAERYKQLPEVMETLARAGKPFIAATPQKVLANPKGPLAFIGHVDLTWVYSFREEDSRAKRRPGRLINTLRTILKSDRVGIGFSELYRYLSITDSELASIYDEAARTRAPPSRLQSIQLGYLWLMRQEIAGYVLLGDPAVRLPVEWKQPTPVQPPVSPQLPVAVTSIPPSRTQLPIAVDKLEEAIGYFMSGELSPRELAAKYGIERREFERLASIYCRAGRAALGIPD